MHKSTRPLHRLIRVVFASCVALYAAVSMLMLASPNGPTGSGPVAYVIFILVLQCAAIVYLLFGPLPDRKWQVVTFLVFGDVGLASVILLDVPTSALIGTFLFALTGSMCTFFLGPRLLVAHLVFANLVIVYIGAAAYIQGLWGPWDAIAAVLVAGGATSGVPIFAQIAWSLVCEDARQSEIDPLTRMKNRRGLQNAIEDLWSVARGERLAFVLVLVDIDRFKSVNDRYGHDQGDAVIVLVADRLHGHLGKSGVVARTGGEEFVAVLVGESEQLCELVLEVSGTLTDCSDPIPVTVSAGAIVIAPDSDAWTSGVDVVNDVTRAADSLMYRAKANGGNRTVLESM
ncbi:GGDEF domain-containing protein [Rhodococcus sp. IEGM 1401]|uniref:GGDEF domain-containing protein n=1 Tax=unclassified Rhodococcus (in: high G+C Gram-positive bacteria) TaxID=192944 RepID=UPI0022B42A96|nr:MULTISPECIES: GGDEF domain-containing protein [unclassified Rhodococcus (in: high G+C Gram-positive bacteria)]MCZ4562453.1 GGDEF domain-containing protein [Rhodococcus sp. IEGM 1401]MDI9922495.1 GGDEF domain-containing protein [Rhodococcus sp. IEGM 1372]MDV8035045.1 GGDEF domain-containing protein [Rhodococcus sp. IEGM 1414]